MTILKSWQIILSGFLPYLIAMSILLTTLYGNHPHTFTVSTMFLALFGGIPIYFFTILPWYYVIYLARHRFGVKAFYMTGFMSGVLQLAVCGLVLGAPFSKAPFWLLVTPVLGSGVAVFMLCMIAFYKQRSEQVEVNN